ncbi:aspartate ammonia-lyase [Paludibacterium purpuratum]|uniref:Aspartate ammonia-lyase n=1 Tax=Paludibacterium purpuratum TaxID=1144873 RepID=A0A4R7AYD9_9NEIS|nr:aspartate ammonia-lyase [Paludibacterium purpuratum]TDR71463.1 aspartate ammonia-lyase [Paludibacterium purpuratum]
MATRVESDSLGSVELPADALYGAHAARARDNFQLSGQGVAAELVSAFAQVKVACARTNAALGYLAPEVADAVVRAAHELAAGQWREAIVVDALQGGAGTSLNMNVNEVLANRAEELLGGRRGEYRLAHPIDHVNLHQSTNDTYPTALKVAAIGLLRQLHVDISELQMAFQRKEGEFAHVVKIGRTQLQDACPMSMAAAFSAWAEGLSRDRWRVSKCEERLRVVNLGGTAIGTGMTAPREYIFAVVERLREETGMGLARAENLVDATQNADVFVEVSGILKAHAVNLLKISADLRLLASGPRAGLGELRLPAMQVGSSIMPGKVNPVICEATAQAAMQVIANDTAITLAAQSGQLELNAFLPLVAHALLGSLSLLCRANRMFRQRCIEGIQVDEAACRAHVDASLSTVTALVPLIGYEAAAALAKHAQDTGRSIAEVVRERQLLSEEALAQALSPAAMTALGFRGQPREPK